MNTPTFIVPLNQIEVTSETGTSIVYNLVVSGPSGVRQDLHYVVHVLWTDSFLAPRGYFFRREPLDQLEISALTECELKRFSGAFRAGAPSPLACLPRARPFSLSPATSKRLLRRLRYLSLYKYIEASLGQSALLRESTPIALHPLWLINSIQHTCSCTCSADQFPRSCI